MGAQRFPMGSTWRKWDLHVHTPASFVHHYLGPDPWDGFLADIAKLPPEMSVLGINDYLFVDGYRRVLAEFQRGTLPNLEAVFPVIELRIDQLVGTRGHLNRINLHVLFDAGIDPDIIEAQFVNGLSASFRLDHAHPGDISWSGFPSDANLALFGAAIRTSMPPERQVEHNESDVELGFNNLVNSLDAVRNRLSDSVFRSRTLIAVGKTEWASLEWNDRSIALKKDIINGADAVFVAAESIAAYRRARTALFEAEVNARLLDCSDAHHPSQSADKDRIGNSLTWINADPTLHGLRHALTEFDHRVYVGMEPPKISAVRLHSGEHLRRVRITKRSVASEPHSFFDVDIRLNPGFIAVVGDKGTGKSALLDAIGLAGNSARENHFTFLNDDRFRNPLLNTAAAYEATVEWCSGEVSGRPLDESVSATEPERVTYLPQQLIDLICSSDPGEPSERFAAELSAVLFAHVPDADRLDTADLDSLLHLRTQAIDAQLTVLRAELETINRAIAGLQREQRPERRASLAAQLDATQKRLLELDAVEPHVPPVPDAETDPALAGVRSKIDELTQARHSLNVQHTGVIAEDSTLAVQLDRATQLSTGIATVRQQLTTFNATYAPHASILGVDINTLVSVSIDLSSLESAIAERVERRDEIAAELDEHNPGSVVAQLLALEEQIETSETQLDLPAREHTRSLREREEWERSRREVVDGSAEGLGITQLAESLRALDNIPMELDELTKQRDEKVRAIHAALCSQVHVYEDLYAPARGFIAEHPLASRCELEFGAELRERDLEVRFWEIFGRNIAGTFFGVSEGSAALREMMNRVDFNDPESIVEFGHQMDRAIHEDRRNASQRVDAERAIRSGHSLEEIYDLIFGLSYLEPYYLLASQGTSIDRLSPGQKGTLLLMFYLLVDPSRKPLLLDQPDENLGNRTVKDLLVPAIKEASKRRQVVVVTHNPNVAVVADADQVIVAGFDGERFEYTSGSIEFPDTNADVVDVLEGTWSAFENRGSKYQGPGALTDLLE
jgi:ABC-type lipoprotein export system ATPase subunit